MKAQEEKAQKLTSSRDLAAEPEVAWNRTSVDYFLSSHYGIEGEKLKNPGTGPEARFYTDDEAGLVRRHRRHRYQVPQKDMNQGNVIDLEATTGRSRDEILAAAQALKIEHRKCDDGRKNDEIGHVIYDGRYRDKEGAYAYSELTSPQVAERITAYLEEVGDALVIPPKPEPATEAASAPEPQAPAKPKKPAASVPPTVTEPPKPSTPPGPPAPKLPKPSPLPKPTAPVEAGKLSSPVPAGTWVNKPKIPPQVTFMAASAPEAQPKPEPKAEPDGEQKPRTEPKPKPKPQLKPKPAAPPQQSPATPAPPAPPAPPTPPKEPARPEAESVSEPSTPTRELTAKAPTPPVAPPPVKSSTKPKPPIEPPVTKRTPTPIPDKKPEPEKAETYLDILAELASLEAPCEEGAVRQVAQACGILRDIKREGRKMVATQDAILKLAMHISKLYKAPAFMKTAPQVADHHGLTMDELASIVANLSSVNTSTMVEVYRIVDAEGNVGPAALHMKPQLQALIERAVQSRRLIPKARDPKRGRRR